MKKLISLTVATAILAATWGVAYAGPISQLRMIVTADSEEPPDWAKELAVDGLEDTFWHTQWKDEQPEYPHWFQVELDKVYDIASFSYLPRQDGNQNGWMMDYELYISLDGKEWGKPVVKDAFPDGSDLVTVNLPSPVAGKFFKLVGLNSINEQPWCGIAELNIFSK